MYESFTPGQQSVFKKFPNYWQKGLPYVDTLTIIDFADDTARVNALLGGQVDAIDNLPTSQIAQVQGNSACKALISQTGQWQPFTMRVDQAPFSDMRVRQAMRLIVDRSQIVEQALGGQGRVANDIYSPLPRLQLRPAAAPGRPRAGRSRCSSRPAAGAEVELTTAPVFQGVVEAAEVFAEQASGRGRQRPAPQGRHRHVLRPQLPQVDVRPGLLVHPRVPAAGRPGQPAQLAVQRDPLGRPDVHEADRPGRGGAGPQQAHRDPARRPRSCEYDSGGYIIWSFSNQIDAYSANLSGFVPAKSGIPLGNYGFKHVGYTA